MHELSLLAGLMRQIEAVARAQGARRVSAVRLRVGALAHLSPEHLREHFEAAARGGVAADARLDVEVERTLDDPRAQEVVLVSLDVEVDL